MAKKKTDDEKYWDARVKQQVKSEYAQFLTDEGKSRSPDSAHLFAIRKISGGFDYMGLKERDLIILLAGSLPPFYD